MLLALSACTAEREHEMFLVEYKVSCKQESNRSLLLSYQAQACDLGLTLPFDCSEEP